MAGNQSPDAAAAAADAQKRLGVPVLTTPENKKDPPPSSSPSSNGGDDTGDVAPIVTAKKDPLAFIMDNRDKLEGMYQENPEAAMKFVDMTFRRYMLPKYKQVNQQFPLTEFEIDKLRTRYITQVFGLDSDPVDLDNPDPKYGTTAKVAATVEGAGAGVLGGVKTLAELQKKINDHLGPIGKPENYLLGKLIPAMGSAEHKAFEDASGVSPTGAKVGAAVGHQIPAAVAAELGGAGVPKAAKAAGTAVKAVAGAARMGVEGAIQGAGTPGEGSTAERAASGAKWGALLGAGFPVLGKLFGLGKATEKVAEAGGETPKEVPTSGAPASSASASAPKNMGEVAELAAQKKFGKPFGQLTNAERAQMPGAIKEEIQAMKAAKAEAAKAKKVAVKQAKVLNIEEARAKKAKEATETVKKDAAQRVPEAAKSDMPAQATAAQAASENPAIAKTLGGKQEPTSFRAGTDTERRVAGTERRTATGQSPTGTERRGMLPSRRVAPGTPAGSAGPIKLAKTEGEKLEESIHKQVRAGEKAPTKLTEGEALQHIMKDAKRYEAFKAMDSKAQGAELAKARNELVEASKKETPAVTKVPEGQEGKKVRAKDGKPASPAQQAADRERQAKAREVAKKEEFGSALDKHAQELAGRFTPQSLSIMHLPDMEAAAKELPGGETILSALGKMRKKYKWNDDTYMSGIKEWLENQFAKSQEAPKE